MPIGYPGNSISKEARAKAGGGFESAIEEVVSGTPAISAVTGAFTAGQSITISGSGFGSKPTAAPSIYEDWSGGTEGQTLQSYDPTWSEYLTNGGGLITTSDSADGGVSAYNDTNRSDFATNYKSFPPSLKVFASSFVKVSNTNSEEAVIKLKRITSSVGSGGGGVYNGEGAHSLSDWDPSNTKQPQIYIDNGNGYMGPPFGGAGEYIPIAEEVWRRIDYEIIVSTPGVADGFFAYESLGLEHNEYPNIINRASGFDYVLDTILLGLMPANNSGTTLTVYEDLIYVDTTFARVEIGDNPDYFLCSYRRLLPPISWTSSNVQASIPHTVPAGTYYVFVINDDRVKSTGFEVTV